MIEVMINGCNGKMGSIVAELVEKQEGMVLKCGVDKENTGYLPYQVYTDLESITEKSDVIIDFSVPVATFNVLEYAKKNSIPVVIATTGFKNLLRTILAIVPKAIIVFFTTIIEIWL